MYEQMNVIRRLPWFGLSSCPRGNRLSVKLLHTSRSWERNAKVAASIQTISSSTYDIVTKPGEKKDVSISLPKTYSARFTEACWYDWWEHQGYFKPSPAKEKFVMLLPPPNVTGRLHIGHAFTAAIQDAIIRWNRMRGLSTLWVPGLDHAGIATQVVVEKDLMRESGVTRHDVGREQFLKLVHSWTRQTSVDITSQLRRLGLSLDWSRSVFTMDERMSAAVNHAFVKLYDDGLITRRSRIVNWCCHLRSTIADIEVENKEIVGPTTISVPGYSSPVTLGYLTSFAYPIVDSDEEIVVATTRLETMLGDTAIAVHPADSRYQHLVGKAAKHPFCDRLLPIIADPAVKPELGTGAIKLTPAHSAIDNQIALQHRLPSVDILDDCGKIVNCGERFNGFKRFDAREVVAQLLQKVGLWRGQQEHQMCVPLCSRSGDIIEPRLKEQWFLDDSKMAQRAIAAVDEGSLKLVPPYYGKTWKHFLSFTGERPWCISRQLWWGHQVPAYRVTLNAPSSAEPQWVVGATEADAWRRAREKLGHEQFSLKRDEDVLDTWFSAALLPFAALGWPNQTADLAAFYPGHMIESGNDILFFWIARMVMLGQHLTGSLPFQQVLLHSLLLSQGKKMSKSKGNVINPMSIIDGCRLTELEKLLESSNLDRKEISLAIKEQKRQFPDGVPECGADALRMALCSYPFKGDAINIEVATFIEFRTLCNKIWQAFRFYEQHFDANFKAAPLKQVKPSALDKWILDRMARLVLSCDRNFSSAELPEIVRDLKLFWHWELSHTYLECSKPILSGSPSTERSTTLSVAVACLDAALRCLSPFMPFLAEELYQRLPSTSKAKSVLIAEFPATAQWESYVNDPVVAQFEEAQHIASDINLFKSYFGMNHRSKRIGSVFVVHDNSKQLPVDVLQHISSMSKLEALRTYQSPPQESSDCYCLLSLPSGWEVYVDIGEHLRASVEVEKMMMRLQKLLKVQTSLLDDILHIDLSNLSHDELQKHKAKIDLTKKELKIMESCTDYLLRTV